MLIVMILIVISLLIYTAIHRHSRKGYIFICYFAGITLITLFSDFYFSKITEYNSIGFLDYKMYSWITSMRLSTNKLIIMFDIGVALFMTAEILAINRYYRLKGGINAALFGIVAFVLWWTNPNTALAMYINGNLRGESAMSRIIAVNYAVIVVFAAFMAAALCVITVTFIKSNIRTRKTGLLAMVIAVAIIDIYMLTSFFVHALRLVVFNNIDMFKFDGVYYELYQRINIVNILFCMSIVCILIFIFLAPHKRYSFIGKKELEEESRELGENFGVVLHSYKNALLGIKKYVEMNMMTQDMEFIKENDKRIEGICDMVVERMQGAIKKMSESKKSVENVDINKCVKEALGIINIPQEIDAVFYDDAECIALANHSEMVEAILNILYNSVDALQSVNIEKKAIHITTGTEADMCWITVSDNAGLLKRNDMRKIFQPYYTTKSLKTNSGMGLFYVSDFVHRYSGDILVHVRPNKCTDVQMVFKKKKAARKSWLRRSKKKI